MIDTFFPIKTVKIQNEDKSFLTGKPGDQIILIVKYVLISSSKYGSNFILKSAGKTTLFSDVK